MPDDLPNLQSALNEDLIRRYATGATPDGIRNLITLMDFWKRQLDRVEIGNRAAWAEVHKLQTQLSLNAEPPGQPHVGAPSPRPQPTTGAGNGRQAPPTKPKPTNQAIEINLGDL